MAGSGETDQLGSLGSHQARDGGGLRWGKMDIGNVLKVELLVLPHG